MVLTSDPAFGFDQTWVSLAFLVWLAICGVVSGVMLPAERKLAAGDLEARRRWRWAARSPPSCTLVMLYLMIWKPGA